MKIKILAALALSALTQYTVAQDVNWINQHAIPLEKDLSFLRAELKDKTVIGLGEASHGTHEFFEQKQRVIQYLVTQLNYQQLGFESPQSIITPINQYLQTGQGKLDSLMQTLGLYHAKEIYTLFEWLAHHNQQQSPEKKVVLFGFDKEDFWGDPLGRDERMAGEISKRQPRQKMILWSHNVHLAKDTTMAQYKGMGWHLYQQFGEAYYALGFDTFKGSVNVLADGNFEPHDFEAGPQSLSALFAQARHPQFFISFRKASPFPINNITNIYSNWTERRALPIRPEADFDGIIFIRESTPSHKL